jgi:ribosomal-protein-serine acetyltransferase
MPCRFELPGTHRLRLLHETDAPELYALIDANRAHLAPWMPWAPGQTLEHTLDFIRTAQRQIADNDGFQVALTDRERIIGVLAVAALIDHALTGWQLNRVEIRADVANLRSRKIPQRLGFQQEGTLRQAARLGERYIDHAVYAMLAADWPAGKYGFPR